MINKDRFNEILAMFKNDFSAHHWKNEKYKWIAVKRFQDMWDINATDFLEMFTKATDKTFNLLASRNSLPRGMMREFIKADPEYVRGMFRHLFNEDINLAERIESFIENSEYIRKKYDNGTWKNHYQNTNAISTYLWLRYPDKYYIYKFSECREVAKELDMGYMPKKSSSANGIMNCYEFYNNICELLKVDEELRNIIKSNLSDECYHDSEFKILTIDFGFYISRYMKNEPVNISADNEIVWWPSESEYELNLTKEDYKKFILEIELPKHQSPMKMLKGMLELGGEASCKKLADVYGGTVSAYVGCAVNLGRRIKDYFNLSSCFDGEQERYFPFAFLGRKDNDLNEYVYCIRSELKKALIEIDLSSISPYYDEEEMSINTENIKNNQYDKSKFLSEVYMKEEKYDAIVRLMKNKKNIILQGAPGVGKTFAAKRLAYSIIGEENDEQIAFVQFHQNYTYEDFVMGYKPSGESFELKYGIFYNFCKKAESDSNKDYFFIIDEINRGNLSKIFGELMMLIECGYRKKKSILAYDGKEFTVPENLYIIGMMNTADRSLAMIDYALRRRFSFVDIEPGFDSDQFIKYKDGFGNKKFIDLIEGIKSLNIRIASDSSLGKGFCIGHSYFCDWDVCDDDKIKDVVEYDIIPTLNEYWFDNSQIADDEAAKLLEIIK